MRNTREVKNNIKSNYGALLEFPPWRDRLPCLGCRPHCGGEDPSESLTRQG